VNGLGPSRARSSARAGAGTHTVLPHCARFYSPYQDGLKQRWDGVCWMNPPYGLALRQWVKKAWESAEQNGA